VALKVQLSVTRKSIEFRSLDGIISR
jgi:hypothetical protein